MVVTRGREEGVMGSCCLMHTEFQFGMMKKSWRWILMMVV